MHVTLNAVLTEMILQAYVTFASYLVNGHIFR